LYNGQTEKQVKNISLSSNCKEINPCTFILPHFKPCWKQKSSLHRQYHTQHCTSNIIHKLNQNTFLLNKILETKNNHRFKLETKNNHRFKV
jgi:hypothetical protein